ncbi:nonstructural protein [Apis mellifera associated microvirus 8]|nr:nonstructural protein [Apis mellifera associated microvirus 8]
MSKKVIVTVRDTKAEAYFSPLFVRSKGEAIRSFADEVNNKDNSIIGQHPEDFHLVYLGTFDEGTAQFELADAPVALARGLDLVRSTE